MTFRLPPDELAEPADPRWKPAPGLRCTVYEPGDEPRHGAVCEPIGGQATYEVAVILDGEHKPILVDATQGRVASGPRKTLTA